MGDRALTLRDDRPGRHRPPRSGAAPAVHGERRRARPDRVRAGRGPGSGDQRGRPAARRRPGVCSTPWRRHSPIRKPGAPARRSTTRATHPSPGAAARRSCRGPASTGRRPCSWRPTRLARAWFASRPSSTAAGPSRRDRHHRRRAAAGPARGAPGAADTIVISSTIVPVTLRVRVGDVGPHGPNTFAISAPGGGPLVDALVSPADIADARARWRDRVRAAVLFVAAFTLVLCAGAMIDVRRKRSATPEPTRP